MTSVIFVWPSACCSGWVMQWPMLITSGANAHMLTDRFRTMMLISMGVGVSSAVIGRWLSAVLDVASGGAMVKLVSAIYSSVYDGGDCRLSHVFSAIPMPAPVISK
ncbi:metal ABC transporter permease [Halovibrio sp. HP20-50]|uniref:metal ABC transporter permease n=1 Tax=Halovibrio sp. HP20-59 TaxID=3080275 RepID=UPI00294AC189|nr:metal ABC transporter permease [Halovibrio sp. HP20-59]MEA2117343.1 metal ABC transporter permease [Halovibrio sp. HP20-59]